MHAQYVLDILFSLEMYLHGLSSSLYPIVARHLVNVVTIQLVEVEDTLVLEHGVDVDSLSRQTVLPPVI